jgi:hypothetical protein
MTVVSWQSPDPSTRQQDSKAAQQWDSDVQDDAGCGGREPYAVGLERVVW